MIHTCVCLAKHSVEDHIGATPVTLSRSDITSYELVGVLHDVKTYMHTCMAACPGWVEVRIKVFGTIIPTRRTVGFNGLRGSATAEHTHIVFIIII